MMRELDGTVTISLANYEGMKRRIEEFESLLNIAKQVNDDGYAHQYNEYLVNINDLITNIIASKEYRKVKVINIESLSDTKYQVKAEMEY